MAKSPRTRRTAGASRPGRLRIVAGKWRRRLLPVADEAGLRPTPERVRETLFNWLAPVIDGARCLDLCAGTGALSFEALSRGADSALLIDKSRVAAAGLRQAARELDAGNADIRCDDAVRYLQEEAPAPFNIVFLDPPFAAALLPELCRLLADRGWLAPRALIYLEQDRETAVDVPAGWERLREKTAGNVRYCLYRAPAPDDAI